MPAYKLTYFALRGRAATIRYILIDNEAGYEEDIINRPDWPAMKSNFLFGQMPKLTVDGTFTLYQSNAIARFLAREFDAYGKNNREAALIDMVVEGVQDMREKFVAVIRQDNFEAAKLNFIGNLPNELTPFEKILKANNNGDSFIVGDKISLADYDLFAVLDAIVAMIPEGLAGFPLLQVFYNRIAGRPRLAAYRSTDAFKNLPVPLTNPRKLVAPAQ